MPIVDSLNNFRSSVAEANSFITIAFQQDANGNYLLPQNARDFINDSAFLKIFIAWETYLESVFLKFLLGEPSILGTFLVRYATPLDTLHGNNMLIGKQKYVDWSDPATVKLFANLYFLTGNHIDAFINSIYSELLDLKTIRNAAAHLTSTTSGKLDSVASRILGSPQTNITVSQLIFSIDPSAAPAGTTVLSIFLSKLEIAAEGIANG